VITRAADPAGRPVGSAAGPEHGPRVNPPAARSARHAGRLRISRIAALCLAGGLGACGAPQRAPDTGAGISNTSRVTDTRTPIERRRDTACDQLGPKLTQCAVDDAKSSFAAGKIDRAQLDRDTAPAIQRKNTEEFEKACKGHAYSSRQIRVLEVCFQEEPQCAPLLDCLGHLSDKPRSAP
jgi:hypothetical protein